MRSSRKECRSAGRGAPNRRSQAADPNPTAQDRLPSISRAPTAHQLVEVAASIPRSFRVRGTWHQCQDEKNRRARLRCVDRRLRIWHNPRHSGSRRYPAASARGYTLDSPESPHGKTIHGDLTAALCYAATESRDKVKQRIDKAQGDVDAAVKDAKQQADQAAAGARSKWAQMKVDTAARMGDVKARVDKRATQLDAKAATSEADWAEADATDAIDYAAHAVDNARLAMLEAIEARAYAVERAEAARA